MKQDKTSMLVAPAELVPWDKNPRNNDGAVDKVAASIKELGFGAPIVARKGSNEIIAGHTRWKAAQKLGLEVVPVRFLDISDEKAQTMALADNKLGEIADWDNELLQEIALDLGEELMDLAGFDGPLVEVEEVEGNTDPDDVPEAPEEPTTKPGDLWILGEHRLLCGDCRDPRIMDKLMAGKMINVAFTSPPYASQRKYDESSGFEPIHPDKFVDWFESVQENIKSHLSVDGSFFVNIKEHCEGGCRSLYVKDLTVAHVRKWEWLFVDEFAWTKSGVPGKWPNRFKNAWEPIFHFSRESAIKMRHENVSHDSEDLIEYSPDNKKTHSGFISGSAGTRSSGKALPSNVIVVHNSPGQTNTGEEKHTATFPVDLPSFFIKAYSDELDCIFDPFMGSGTTIMAAEVNSRRAFGTEISPAYCDIIVKRWEDFTGNKAELADG